MNSIFPNPVRLEAITSNTPGDRGERYRAEDAALISERLYRERRRRDHFFAAGLFAEPAWDMLLDLRMQHATGVAPSASSACIGAAVPPTTALRHMLALESQGLVVRGADPTDARRKLIRLSERGLELMDAYLSELAAVTQVSGG